MLGDGLEQCVGKEQGAVEVHGQRHGHGVVVVGLGGGASLAVRTDDAVVSHCRPLNNTFRKAARSKPRPRD